jgi:hypothetical protein
MGKIRHEAVCTASCQPPDICQLLLIAFVTHTDCSASLKMMPVSASSSGQDQNLGYLNFNYYESISGGFPHQDI